MDWKQTSGAVEADARYLLALHGAGWRDWKKREEARLRLLYSPEHMKAVQRILQFHCVDFEPYRQLPARQWYGRGGE